MRVHFEFPKNKITDLIVQSIADSLAYIISDPLAAVEIDLDQGLLLIDIEADTQVQETDRGALKQLQQQYSAIKMEDIGNDWVRIIATLPIPSEVARLLKMIREINDVIYVLPPEIDELCTACGISAKESNPS